MRRLMLAAWAAALTTLTGCASGPPLDNPFLLHIGPAPEVENPVYVPLGPPAYSKVFENVLEVVNEYFDISYANRYDGRIETFARVEPGLEQLWKPSTPNLYERLLATFQSMGQRCVVLIQPANDGGFFIKVTVYRQLEDVPQPVQATAGSAIFRVDPIYERQFEVVDPAFYDKSWIPLGEDHDFEQAILCKIKKSM